jgi:hypothetical protein
MYHSCFSAVTAIYQNIVPLCAIPLGAEHRCQASKIKLTAMAMEKWVSRSEMIWKWWIFAK